MSEPSSAQDFATRSAQISDLGNVLSLLYWDQRTQMPPGGAEARAHQIATIESLAHQKLTDPGYARALEYAEQSAPQDPASFERASCRVARRRIQDAVRLPSEFVEDLAWAASAAVGTWVRARERGDFAAFAPHLETLVGLQRRKAELLGYEDNPYDALLGIYEPGLTTSRVSELFAALRERLAALLARIGPQLEGDSDSVLHGRFDPDSQIALTRQIISELGYDFQRGRQDLTVHPFAVSIGGGDVRVTLRTEPDFLGMAVFASIHEAGHAMHSQGVPGNLSRTALGDCESLVICESQSRLWENMVGRSRPFADRLLAGLSQYFPSDFADVSPDLLYRDCNRVRAGFIRVESDEIHYNLHVILRFEIEQELISGQLAVGNVPERWAELSAELLGVTPPDDAHGCLQDVHWSQAAMGYFPTYSLGNLLAAQLYQAALEQDSRIAEQCQSGVYSGLLDWMQQRVHRHGSKWNASELADYELGCELDAEPFLNYLESKFDSLYPSGAGVAGNA